MCPLDFFVGWFPLTEPHRFPFFLFLRILNTLYIIQTAAEPANAGKQFADCSFHKNSSSSFLFELNIQC
jgi:hypothetical protein